MLINHQLRNQNGFAFALEFVIGVVVVLGVVITAVYVQGSQSKEAKKAQAAAAKADAASSQLPPGTYVMDGQSTAVAAKTPSTSSTKSNTSSISPKSSSTYTKTTPSTPAPPPAIVHPTIANCGSVFTAYASIASGSAVYQGSNSSLVVQTVPFATAVSVSCNASNSPWVTEEASPYGSMLYGELSLTRP